MNVSLTYLLARDLAPALPLNGQPYGSRIIGSHGLRQAGN